MIFTSGSCIAQGWHTVKNSDKMFPCSFSWLQLKPSMGVSQLFTPGQTADTPVLCCYKYLCTSLLYFNYSFISLWCLFLRLRTSWVFQSMQQPFHLSVLITFRGLSFPTLSTPFKNRDPFLKPMCLFLFDVLKHDNTCLVCGHLLFWSGCSFHLRSNNGFCSSVLQATCGCSCMCVTVFNHLLKVVLFELLVQQLFASWILSNLFEGLPCLSPDLVPKCSPLFMTSAKTVLF